MSITVNYINDDYAVTTQITIADISEIKELGFHSIINNRPDGEENMQPTQEELKKAIEAAGLNYAYLPIKTSGFEQAEVDQLSQLLKDLPRPVLSFCRTGNRSKNLYQALTQRTKDSTCALTEQKCCIKQNIGMLDRFVRIALGLVLISGSLFGLIGMWGWIGLILILTGLIRFCPAYFLLKTDTCKIKKQ